jgi:glucose/arabinose dehydrogenase
MLLPGRLSIAAVIISLLVAGCTPAAVHQTLVNPTQVANPTEIAPTSASAIATNPSASPARVAAPTLAPTAANTSTAPRQMPDPSAYKWAQIVSGISAPTDIKNAGDGSGRLFILEQPGRIRVLKDGQLQAAAFLDITDRVGSANSEQGLLGFAFHPNFAQNGYFYVNYTDLNGNTHIARFTASGNFADPGSEKKLLFVQQPFPNHNGGSLAFGSDGTLYIGLGDGGSQGDPYGNAQSDQSLLGKILRIDVNNGEPYSIPADNPNAARGAGLKEIWAKGLRNPWRFSFDSLTGDLWIGDVGQNLWEEIDFVRAGQPAGLNFGWNKLEATHPYRGIASPEFTAPVAEYPHAAECAVTGGVVYRGKTLPEWQGIYLYGDYCSGAIWGLPSPLQGKPPVLLFQTGFKISTFGVDEAGDLYIADYQGSIYRLEKSN